MVLRAEKMPGTRVERIKAVTKNFFLHIQGPRTHLFSLRFTYTYGLGLMAFSLFVILILTGILLMVYYIPVVGGAYHSVTNITTVVGAGKFIRNMHRWADHALIIVLMLHVARVFYTGSYKGRRKLNWLIGCSLMFIVVLFSFSGYLLPWDQLSYWATTTGVNIAASLRELTDLAGITHILDLGGLAKYIITGGTEIGQDTLNRFYMLHVVFFPLLCILLISLHFWRIRKDGGLSRPRNADIIVTEGELQPDTSLDGSSPDPVMGEDSPREQSSPSSPQASDPKIFTWPTVIWAETAVFMFTLAVVAVLAFAIDAPLRDIANPAIPENPAKSPWYLLGIQELVAYSAVMGGILIPAFLGIILCLIPYWDQEEAAVGVWFSGRTGRRIALFSFLSMMIWVVLLLFITVRFGWLNQWLVNVPPWLLMLFNPGTLTILFLLGGSAAILQRTQSTRLAAIGFFTGVMTAYLVFTIMGLWFRGPNWEFYWSPSQWPAF